MGDFKDDFKEGFGVLYISNGEKFEGHFCNDIIHGKGVYFKRDGNIISGVWDQNKFQKHYNWLPKIIICVITCLYSFYCKQSKNINMIINLLL